MNKSASFFTSVMLLFVIFSCQQEDKKEYALSSEISSTDELFEMFTQPPASYKSAPLWSWNHKITRDEIEFQLKEFREEGIGGVFIHPRPGLITEYLSDEWFDLCKFTMEKGKELGLKTWMYDENSFPSGFAGGHVQHQMPSSYNKGIALIPHKFNTMPDTAGEFYIILKKSGNEFVDVTNDAVGMAGESGNFYAFTKGFAPAANFTGGYPYVDLLHDSVTETFIRLTMAGYEKVFGEEFGKAVPGIFTDEPNIGRGTPDGSIRWTPKLFDVFEGTWGYSLIPHLPALLEETGNWKTVRHNYYQVVLQRFIDRWAKPWHEYTEKHNLKWTGHYWEHGWPSPHHGGDNMAMYAWHQMPGIDMLFNTRSERPDQFGNNRAVKELISVANQFGYNRTLSETYGGSGWDLTFEDMLRNGNWQYALGVNFLNQHLSYYSILGTRKYDFPQSISYQTSWWDYYDVLAQYFARLSVALAAGDQLNRILVLEPTTSAWMYFSPKKSNQAFDRIGESFENFVDELEEKHIEYDLGCENIIKDHGRVDAQTFIIKKRGYDIVVIPPGMENLDSTTFSLLKQYAADGGHVYSFSGVVDYIDGKKSDAFKQMATDYGSQIHFAGNINQVLDIFAPNGLKIDNQGTIKGELYHHRRLLRDAQLLFFTNFDPEEISKATVEVNTKHVYLMSLYTGQLEEYPSVTNKEKSSFEIEIHPGEGQLFLCTDKPLEAKKVKRNLEYQPVQTTDSFEIQRGSDNVLVLDYCDITYDNRKHRGLNYYDATMKLFKDRGFTQGNPWTVAVQFKQEYIEQGQWSDGSGFEVEFPFYVSEDVYSDVFSSFKAAIENPGLYDVFINDSLVSPMEDEWWLERTIGVFHLGDKVRYGNNIIKLVCRPMSVFTEIEPVFILGDFSVAPADKGFIIKNRQELKTGSWKEQGLPMYAREVNYSGNFSAEGTGTHYKVRLTDWNGTVTHVSVNGEDAGLIFCQPYELDISEFVHEGNNTITVSVTGSLKNVLGPFHGKQRRGIVTPWSWKYPPEKQPAGDDYHLIDYGLFEEFQILRAK